MFKKNGVIWMTEKHYCGHCVYFTRFYCPKRNKQVSYSGYTCDDFELKGDDGNE